MLGISNGGRKGMNKWGQDRNEVLGVEFGTAGAGRNNGFARAIL